MGAGGEKVGAGAASGGRGGENVGGCAASGRSGGEVGAAIDDAATGGDSTSGAVVTCAGSDAGGDTGGGVLSSSGREAGGAPVTRGTGGALAAGRGALDNAGAHAAVASASVAMNALRNCRTNRASMRRGDT